MGARKSGSVVWCQRSLPGPYRIQSLSKGAARMKRAEVWSSRPLFISSTFIDFNAERDHLRNVVFPELEERLQLEGLCLHLSPIDLRWGVDTLGDRSLRELSNTADVEIAKQHLVLRVCLDEMELSRPFVIVLLGNRYGWVPPMVRTQWAADRKGLNLSAEETELMSVTALEVEYGILRNVGNGHRCRIYNRHLDTDGMSPTQIAQYFDSPGSINITRLKNLRDRIAGIIPSERIHRYDAKWDQGAKAVRQSDLVAWGKNVAAHLWEDIRDEYRDAVAKKKSSAETRATEVLDQFVEDRIRIFHGRESLIKMLVDFALDDSADRDGCGLCVAGPPGSGKSSVWAKVFRHLSNKNCIVLSHAAGITGDSMQIDHLLSRWVGELRRVPGCPLKTVKTGSSREENPEEVFLNLLSEVALKQRVVLLLDAVNELEDTPRGIYSTWLPEKLPYNVRMIVTSTPGPHSDSLAERNHFRTERLKPLTTDEARQIAVSVCREQFHRELKADGNILNQLCSRENEGQTGLCVGNPLWLRLAIDELNSLEAEDFERAHSSFSGTADQQLHQMMMEVVSSLPANVPDLYERVLERSARVAGDRWAQNFAMLLMLTRNGLRTSDLEVILPQVTGDDWNDYRFAMLRRIFRMHLVQRGLPLRYNFFHGQMKPAVSRWLTLRITPGTSGIISRIWNLLRNKGKTEPGSFNSMADVTRRMHTVIARHLLSLSESDPVARTETLWHLASSGDKTAAARYYNQRGPARDVEDATSALLAFLLDAAEEDRHERMKWIASWPEIDAFNIDESADMAQRLATEFDRVLKVSGLIELRLQMLNQLRDNLLAASRSYFNKSDAVVGFSEQKRELMRTRFAHQIGSSLQRFTIALLDRRIAEAKADVGKFDDAKRHLETALKTHTLMDQLPDLAHVEMTVKTLSQLLETVPALTASDIRKYRHIANTHIRNVDRRRQDFIATHGQQIWDSGLSLPLKGEYALARENLALIEESSGNTASARDLLLEALKSRRENYSSLPENPTICDELMIVTGRLGDLAFRQNDIVTARTHFSEALRLGHDRAMAAPESNDAQRNWARCLEKIGKLELLERKYSEANDHLARALKICRRVSSKAPNNVPVQRELCECYCLMSMLQVQSLNDQSVPMLIECQRFFEGVAGTDLMSPMVEVAMGAVRKALEYRLNDSIDVAVRLVRANRHQRGFEVLKTIEEIALALDNDKKILMALEQQAIAMIELRNEDEACEILGKLIAQARTRNDMGSLIFGLGLHSRFIAKRQRIDEAFSELTEAISLCREVTESPNLKSILLGSAEIIVPLGTKSQADRLKNAMASIQFLRQ